MTVDKIPDDELVRRLRDCPPYGTWWSYYQHPDDIYMVQGSAILEATQEPVVLHGIPSTGILYARPLKEWSEEVLWNGEMVKRFTRVG